MISARQVFIPLALTSFAAGQTPATLIEVHQEHLPVARAAGAFLADFDRDGNLDAVIPGLTNTLLRNDGGARFSDVSVAALPPGVGRVVAVGDFDGDGDVDLMRTSTQSLALLTNDGRSVFSLGATLALGADVAAAAVGDVDNDGDLDVVVTHAFSAIIPYSLLRNDGTGRFAVDSVFGAAASTSWPYLVDVDGDRDLDLFVVGPASFLLENRGGSFATPIALPPLAMAPTKVVAADVDGDGDQDVLLIAAGVGATQTRALLINDGSGHYSEESGRLATTAAVSVDAAALDVDGDGDVDFVFGHAGHRSEVLRNDGTGHFTPTSAGDLDLLNAPTFAVGDLDGDGVLDLLTSPAHVFLGRRDGSFVLLDRTPVEADGTVQLVADLDGDGDVDLVRRDAHGVRVVARNDGTGHFAVYDVLQNLPDTSDAVASGDVDGDGDLDLVYALGFRTRRLATLFNDGHGHFGPARLGATTATSGAQQVHLVDIDGDGDLDVVDVGDTDVRIATNDGRGTFGGDVVLATDLNRDGELTDVDGDGDVDVLLGNALTLLENDRGTFSDTTALRFPERPVGYGIPRLHRDAGGTVVFWCRATGIDVYERAGSQFVLRPPFTIGVAGQLQSATLLHPSAGDVQLVVGVELSGEDRLFAYAFALGFGFRDVTTSTFGVPPAARAIVDAADVDLDGDLDVLAQDPGPNAHLLRGSARRIHAPFAAQLGRSFELDVGDAAASVLRPLPAAVLLGAPVRIPLPGLGVLRVDPRAALTLPLVLASPNDAALILPVPANVALRDAAFAAQTVHVDRLGRVGLGAAVRATIR